MPAVLLLVVLLVHANAVAAAGASAPVEQPDIAVLVKRIIEAQLDNRTRVKPYSVTREYKVFAANTTRPRTEVLARVNFLPPNLKSYDIDQSTGGMGETIVRRILDHEVDAARDPKMLMVNEKNYDFALAGEASAGGTCYKLEITPKHARKDLLKATIWVDKDSYRIQRIEGEPAKSPSFWVKDVHVVIEFAEVAGMWLQIDSQAMAHLRFGGEYKITSQDLTYDVSSTMAVNAAPIRLSRRHSPAIMATSMR